MLAPLLVCGWIGLWLDERFDTTLCFLVMMLLGVLAAFRNFFQLVRGFYEKDLKREGIEVINKLDTLSANSLASSVANRLCKAFPTNTLYTKVYL